MNTLSDLIQEAKSQGKHYAVFKNWHQPTPTRKEIDAMYGPEDEWFRRLQLENREVNSKIQYFIDEANKAYPESDNDFYIFSNIYYRNSYYNKPGSKLHHDMFDVIHWHCTGVTKWNVGIHAEAKNDYKKAKPDVGTYFDWDAHWTGPYDTFILEPGDVLWFDNMSWHETENICDKYSVIMQAGKIYKDMDKR